MTENILRFEDRAVRMIDKEGEPWWVASDVCDVLGIKQPTRAVEGLDEDEKGVTITHTPGGDQSLLTVNESGLYSLILRSRKPEAKRFKRWVTHEVLPALRKTGMYIVPSTEEGGIFAGAMELAKQFTSVENRLARIEANMNEARSAALDLPEPLGVLPGMTNKDKIQRAARAYCQFTGCKVGALWPQVYFELENRFRVRINARKPKMWKGSTLSFAIHDGHGEKVYMVLRHMLESAMIQKAA